MPLGGVGLNQMDVLGVGWDGAVLQAQGLVQREATRNLGGI